ncbi:MAG: DUF4326 domain-containing protein [Cellulomonas sp.]|nr:DUF4326 domain-containing protein [Cellulomonas sp.]MCR6649763.1 DUF4326 domain-containing protein [Cellulomonas sp.]
MSPKRIQMTRQRPWRNEHPDAVIVARPTVFGNPFRAVRKGGRWAVVDDNDMDYEPYRDSRDSAIEKAVELFEADLTYWLGGRIDYQPGIREAIRGLRGRDLACWCPLDQPCHADVLLEIANEAAA